MKYIKSLKSIVHALIISIAYVLRIEHLPFLARSRKYGAEAFLGAYTALENLEDCSPEKNGEYSFLKRIIVSPANKGDAFVAFDVGANRGSYARTVLAFADEGGIHVELHAFEPMQKSYDILSRDSVLNRSCVYLNHCAISSLEGMITMHADEPDSESASIAPRDLRYREIRFDHTERVCTLRLDTYIIQKKISKIDFMKIDVEGHELEVLRGLGDFLKPEIVSCIQFEYGGTSGILFDLYTILENSGYHIYKTTKNGHLTARPYDPMMEKFFSNYIAQV